MLPLLQSYETRKTVRDSEGHTQTTITRSSKDGQKETITTYGDEGGSTAKPFFEKTLPQQGGGSDESVAGALLGLNQGCRKHLFSKNGYVLPKNLWWLQAQTNRNELTTILVDHRFNFHFIYNTYFPSIGGATVRVANHRSLSSFSEPNMCVVEAVEKLHSASEWNHPLTNIQPDNHCYYPMMQAYINNGHDDYDVSEQRTATVLRSNIECPVDVLVLQLRNLLLALVVMISLSSIEILISLYNINSYQHLAGEVMAAQRMQSTPVERTSIMSNEWKRRGQLWKLVHHRRFNRCYTAAAAAVAAMQATSARKRLCLWYSFTLDSYRYDLSNKFAILSANNFDSWLLWSDPDGGSAVYMKQKTKFRKRNQQQR